MASTARIDLRSDTVTQPTAEMRAAMAAAVVGDDVYLEDPTVNRLQERAAEIFEREAALFVPSGTMGNQIAVRLHTKPGQEVITEERGHIFNYEMAGMAAISGVLARTVMAPDGILSWPLIKPLLRGGSYYRAHTGLVTLENTHNMAGGTLYSKEQTDEICMEAHAFGIRVHMDGARIFNAAAALRTRVAELTSSCDSVMFCLSKGLGAPVGSILLGSKALIEEARSVRKMLGGGMRQAGVLAAAGLIALEKMPWRLEQDHENARLLADLLAENPMLDLDPSKVRTNIVIMGIARTGLDSALLAERFKCRGLHVGIVNSNTMRLLTHFNVDRDDVFKASRIIADVLHSGEDRSGSALLG